MMVLKKIFVITVMIILILLFAGCADQSEIMQATESAKSTETTEITELTNETSDEPGEYADKIVFDDGFAFIYNGVDIYMGEYIENVISKIGAGSDSFISESCTSEGMMITHIYGGFEISAYAKTEGDEYRIFSIELRDDSVATAEKIYIGQTADDMIAVYGTDYEDIFGFYRYNKNGAALGFSVDGGVITGITYQLLIID